MSVFRNKILYLILGALILGVIAGIFLDSNFFQRPSANSPTNSLSSFLGSVSEFHAGANKLINPLYECNTGQPYGTQELLDLKNTISSYIDKLTANNSVTRVSVQYRDLNSGAWFGINEHDNFSPSSLLKVPVMMAFYKEAETNPSILQKRITYASDPFPLVPQDIQTKNPIQKGKTYTIQQLIERMIIGSDNAALGLLEQNISNDKINQVTIDLGITTQTNATAQDFMDVSEYSTLFRVLYYSTYLTTDYSEKALEILSQSEFNSGLNGLLPKDITVAHKFGERALANGDNQLHDCGIVYYPKRPYLICVMTQGTNFNDLETTIQQISNQVYLEVSKANPN